MPQPPADRRQANSPDTGGTKRFLTGYLTRVRSRKAAVDQRGKRPGRACPTAT
jgi:hypothetical protein